MERYVVGAGAAGRRVLLLHGLTGSPIELWPLAEGLAADGWRVELPLWPGHGTRAEALARTSARDLVEAAGRLGREGADAIVGFSMGGLLAMVAAAAAPRPTPLVLLAPAVRMAGGAKLFDLLGRLPWLPAGVLLDKGGAEAPVDAPVTAPLDGPGRSAMEARPPGLPVRYDRVPLVWARRLRAVRAEARRAAAQLSGDALVLHGTADCTADVASVGLLAGWSRSVAWERRYVDGAPHQLCTSGWRGGVADEVARFLRDRVAASRHAAAS